MAINLSAAEVLQSTIAAAAGGTIVLAGGAGVAGSALAAGTGGYLSTTAANSTATMVRDTVTGFEGVVGSALADYIVGSATADTIAGGDGADDILAGAGNDTIIVASTGQHDAGETLDGGAGNDTLSITGTTTLITTNASIANIENIAISGTSTVVTTGQTEDFAITITDTATTLTTGTGSDTITLTAGTGVNTFTPLLTSGSDTIVGFDVGEDVLDLDTLGAVANTAAAGTAVNSVTHITAGAFTDNSAYVISDGGLALTATGVEVITDYTDLTDVAAYLDEGYTSTAAADEGQFVINDVAGAKTYVYHFLEGSGGASTISDAELTLVLTITEESGAVLTTTEIV
jgi:Ca2+-binding RTX toxin-like protein